MTDLRVGLLQLIGPDVVFPDWPSLPHLHRVTEQRDGFTVTTTMVEEKALRALLKESEPPADPVAVEPPEADHDTTRHEVAALWGSAENGVYTVASRLHYALAALTKMSALVPGWDE